MDEIPSPYLTGLLDQFFDGRLTPFLETNRGCPFKCSFCHTGADYFQKINMFSIDRIREEITYIGPRAHGKGVVNLHIADTNFAMYPRDQEVCEALLESQRKFGWPYQVMATTGKNNKERIIKATSILGNMFSVNMSVQSMNEGVLRNINRSNIKIDDYIQVNQYLNEQGRSTKGELIIGLPGDTKESFIQGVEQVIEAGVSSVTIYTLMLLHGTKFKDSTYRKKFGIKGKYRIVPLNFGEYAGNKVFDYEEVGVENNDMSFDDYLALREYALLVETLINGRPFGELFRYASILGEKSGMFLRRIHACLDSAPEQIRELTKNFSRETRDELWNRSEDLVEYYRHSENYKRLMDGSSGGNLIYKYKAASLAFFSDEWLRYLEKQLRGLVVEKYREENEIKHRFQEIKEISSFCRNKLNGVLNSEADTSVIQNDYNFRIVEWLLDKTHQPLSSFLSNQQTRYTFAYSPEQLDTRKDLFSRYGKDVNALSKIVTRISNLESLFRRISTGDRSHNLVRKAEGDDFVRYSLSH